MKKMSVQTKTLIKSSITLFVLLCCLITALSTFGWFAMNKKVSTNNQRIVVEPSSKVVINNAIILKRDGSGHAVDVTGQDNINLSEYDSLMSDRKVRNPIIVKCDLEMPNLDAYNNYPFNTNLYWIQTVEWEKEFNDHTYLNNILSNVIQVRCYFCNDSMLEIIDNSKYTIDYVKATGDFDEEAVYYSYDLITNSYVEVLHPVESQFNNYFVQIRKDVETINYDNIYNEAISYLNSRCAPKTFLQCSKEGNIYSYEEKKSVITNQFLSSSFEDYIRDGILTVLYEIDYNDLAVETFSSYWQYAEEKDDSDQIDFVGDLSNIVFKDGELHA